MIRLKCDLVNVLLLKNSQISITPSFKKQNNSTMILNFIYKIKIFLTIFIK